MDWVFDCHVCSEKKKTLAMFVLKGGLPCL